VLDINLPRVGDEQWVLLMSDVHWDNPMCNRELLKAHLDLALKRNAPVVDAGDFYCAMQGKYDKRSSKKDIRPEHCKNDYLDALVNTAADWLHPYRKILTVRGIGNHESAIYKNHETDLIERLAERLRGSGGIARRGGYSGYVRFSIKTGGRTSVVKLWYFHGSGGGGPVTRGVIQSNRQAVYISDADIVLTGHTHDAWQVPIQRIRLNGSDRVEQCRQTHIKVGGYKEEFCDGMGGFHVERGGPPKPTGSCWLRFYAPSGSIKRRHKIAEFDAIEAK
jgi:predicted phosphodiesterase